MSFRHLIAVCAAAVIAATASFAQADVAAGKKVFKKCKACHTVNKGGKKRIGPNLFGIVGRKAGMSEGFKYSKAMKNSGIMWDDANLDGFIKKPRKFMKGTKMSFGGIKKEQQRKDLIAYLKTLK